MSLQIIIESSCFRTGTMGVADSAWFTGDSIRSRQRLVSSSDTLSLSAYEKGLA